MDYAKTRFKKLIATKGMYDAVYSKFLNRFSFDAALKVTIFYIYFLKEINKTNEFEDDQVKNMAWFALGVLCVKILLTLLISLFIPWYFSIIVVFSLMYVFFYLFTIGVNIFQQMEEIELTTQEKRNHKLKNLL